jgi:hypothetical protein
VKPNNNVADMDGGEADDVDVLGKMENALEEVPCVKEVADGEEVEDVDEEKEEDFSLMDVNNPTTSCCAFIESTCFALALVVIGMVMGTLLPSPTVADAAEVNPTEWQKLSTTHPTANAESWFSTEVGLHVTRDQAIWSLTGLGVLISLVFSLWVVALYQHLRVEKKRSQGIQSLSNMMSECLSAHVADSGRGTAVSLQVNTMETSLFDALIRTAMLHDHHAYLAKTSLTKLTIHAVANRVVNKSSRTPRLTRATDCFTHPRVRTLRTHLRKIVMLVLLGVAHARSTVPRVSLPPNQLPPEVPSERDMRLIYLAVLPLVILVPLLTIVMVTNGDEASSAKRRRTEDPPRANDETSVQSSTTQRTGGGANNEPRVRSSGTQSDPLSVFPEVLPHTVHNPRPHRPHQTVYEVLSCWIDRQMLHNVWANKSREYDDCPSNEKRDFWNRHAYDRPRS